MLNVSRILVFVMIAVFMGTSAAIAQNAPPPPQSQPMMGQPMPGHPTTSQPKPKHSKCKQKGCPNQKKKTAAKQAQQAGMPPVNPPR